MDSGNHHRLHLADTVRERFLARYRDPAMAASPSEWNGALDTMLAHKSVRAYSDAPLPADLIETIVAAGQSAPSSSNLQFWSVVAVRDAERKARLSRVASNQSHVANAPLLLVFVADLSRPRLLAGREGRSAEGLDYLETFIVAVADAAFAAQNAVVALESMGLGCCYIGSLRNDPIAVARELNLPSGAFAVFGMTVGYPDPANPADVKPRLPQESVLHYEQYGAIAPEPIAAYDDRMKSFRAEQGLSDTGWTEQAIARVETAKSLMGRDTMSDTLRKLGFALR